MRFSFQNWPIASSCLGKFALDSTGWNMSGSLWRCADAKTATNGRGFIEKPRVEPGRSRRAMQRRAAMLNRKGRVAPAGRWRRCARLRLVFVFEFRFYFRFGIIVDDDFVGLELVGVAG